MKKQIILIISLFLSACASIEPHQFVGPNGGVAYSMKCSGAGRTLDACYQKAGELCPKGYSIVNSEAIVTARNNLAVECK